jgi:hypothetical protein
VRDGASAALSTDAHPTDSPDIFIGKVIYGVRVEKLAAYQK